MDPAMRRSVDSAKARSGALKRQAATAIAESAELCRVSHDVCARQRTRERREDYQAGTIQTTMQGGSASQLMREMSEPALVRADP